MENSNKYPVWERPVFLFVITLAGGFMNAYTFVTRHGILANMHTANMSKLGVSIALGNWDDALFYFLPIICCIFGAASSEWLKAVLTKKERKHDWRICALVIEAIALFLIGFVPLSADDFCVTLPSSFFMGYQLCLFRSCMGTAHNTTICTGNIRNVGQKLFAFLNRRDRKSLKNLVMFASITFAFMLGAIPGTLASNALQEKAVWCCSLVVLLLAFWMVQIENRKAKEKALEEKNQ
ncbi:MAG: DUF1275 domain-containing protein [Clostridia bacterium]|nr:DUF1275 domain-containing protein [Clostridia bacterium]